MIMSVAKAVVDGNEVVGVFSIDINMNSLISLVEGVQIADTGYAAIFNDNGTFLSHPEPELVGTDISEEDYYLSIMEQESPSGVIQYEYNDNDKTLGYSINETMGWILKKSLKKKERLSFSQSLLQFW
jgi:methyl-accepting chemotaxis protein